MILWIFFLINFASRGHPSQNILNNIFYLTSHSKNAHTAMKRLILQLSTWSVQTTNLRISIVCIYVNSVFICEYGLYDACVVLLDFSHFPTVLHQ